MLFDSFFFRPESLYKDGAPDELKEDEDGKEWSDKNSLQIDGV